MDLPDNFLHKAHSHSFKNKKEIMGSKMLGCFFCLKIYPVSDISDDDFPTEEPTLFCPHCGIDSVIGDASGIELSNDLLEKMNKVWFQETVPYENLVVIDKFRDKVLAVRNYKSDKNEFGVTDFMHISALEPILDEIIVSESDITLAGKTFLEEYYGFEELSETLFHRGNLKEIYPEYKNAKDIEEVIKGLEPMVARTFIEKARGNINEESKLKDDLLPPK